MSAAERVHVPAPEEVMAYLDGEPTAMSPAEMQAHLGACETCRAIAADLRGVSEQARTWSVASAPPSFHVPDVGRKRAIVIPFTSWRPSRVAIGSLGLAAAVLIVIQVGMSPARKVVPEISLSGPRIAKAVEPPVGRAVGGVVEGIQQAPPPAAPIVDFTPALRSPEQGQAAPRGPMVIRTATLRIVVKAFGSVRATVEGIVTQAGGFVDHLSVNDDSASARSISGSLRVPSDRMSGVLDRLRQLGQVVEDTQGSEDVTDQIVDLDARLANARATEQRLTDLLKNRTGRLSDVLSVERELARVRLDIERLDAEKTNLARRVAYATIAIQISEERKVGLETGPLPLSTRVRVAAADGAAAAIETVVGALLFLLGAGPTLLVWGLAAAGSWLIVRRRITGWGSRSRASE
jgi:hypothetical protein